MTDFRVLCADLLAWAEKTSAHYYQQPDVLIRARAALAQPEPEVVGPSDEELPPRVGQILRLAEIIREVDGNHSLGAAALAEAILSHPDSRWGRPAPAPAGEVADEARYLAKELRDQADDLSPSLELFGLIHRAADLLERQAAPVPMAVSERLPQPEDCDTEGSCWLLGKIERDWRLINPEKSGLPHLKYCFSHWLPASALPLPSGEVERD